MTKDISENLEAEERSKGPAFSSMVKYHQSHINGILVQKRSEV